MIATAEARRGPSHRVRPSLLCSVLTFLALLAACSGVDEPQLEGKAAGEIRYAFWGIPEEKAVQDELKKAFEAEQPDVTVELNHVSTFEDFYPQMLTQIGGGNAPDVMYLGEGAVSSFADRNAILDLAPLIERDDLDLDVFFDGVVDPLMDDEGHIWALAKDTGPIMLYYNRDLFEAAGVPLPTTDWTWDDMVSAAEELTVDTDGDGEIDQWGIGLDTYWTQYMAAIYSNGGEVLNDERNECLLDEPAAAEALQREADLMNEDPVVAPSPDILSGMGVGIQELFNSGQVAMFTAGRWGAFFTGDADFRWDVAPFPYMKAPKTIATFVTLAIPRNAPNPNAAWEFIKFVLSEEGQRINGSTGLGMPVLQSVAKEGSSWLLSGEPKEHVGVYMESLSQRAEPLPFHPQWQETIDEIATRELDSMWLGERSADDATSAICDAIDPIIEGN